jgi:dihydroxy-acid dehydratase
VEDGDIISISIPERTIQLDISNSEIEKREKRWKPREPKYKTGWLARYSKMATSADTGGILSAD